MRKRGVLEKNRDQSRSLIRDFYASSDQVVHEYADVSCYSPFFTRIRGGLFKGSVDGKQFAFKHALQIERRSFSQVQRIFKSEIAALMIVIIARSPS